MNEQYDEYAVWKKWSTEDFMNIKHADIEYFDAEFKGLALAGRKVLEIGFGNGDFLAWAHSRGACLFGTEISPEALQFAKARGVCVLNTDLLEEVVNHGATFDFVVSFDVLEHLTFAEVAGTLKATSLLLKPGGKFLARFPNGQSPFGRVNQHADVTHISTLSVPILQQMIVTLPFSIVRSGDIAEVLRGHFASKVAKKLRNMLRRLLEITVMKLFTFTAPFGVNSIIVLEKTEALRSQSVAQSD